MSSKISPNLAAQLEKLDADIPLDVGLELSLPMGQTEPGWSRPQKIKALKENFNQNTEEIEQFIGQVGGMILERGWLNGTLLAHIPAHCLHQLSEIDTISALDIPRTIESD